MRESLAQTVRRTFDSSRPFRVTAYDGSSAGPADAALGLDIASPAALSFLAAAPGELGLVRAYVDGHLQLHGDAYDVLKVLESFDLRRVPIPIRLGLAGRALGHRVRTPARTPAVEARLRGRRHSRRRDSAAVAYHYDVSNEFFELLLGPSMTYTCAVFADETTPLEQAQFAKHDLVCRKLGLAPGSRLLDVGCGWGAMVMHAARHHRVRALGVTLSRAQASWAQAEITRQGLSGLAEVRHLDYRDIDIDGFDAISSIGLTEHIGKANLPPYLRFLHDRLRPGGRLLLHTSTRADNTDGVSTRPFLDRYVWPDMELVGIGRLIGLVQNAGFEVRHTENLREHYPMTLRHWTANLERHWMQAMSEIGLARARVWRLFLVGGTRGYERNLVQHHQILAVRLDDAISRMPLRPTWT